MTLLAAVGFQLSFSPSLVLFAAVSTPLNLTLGSMESGIHSQYGADFSQSDLSYLSQNRHPRAGLEGA
jgi:hypothetical protein